MRIIWVNKWAPEMVHSFNACTQIHRYATCNLATIRIAAFVFIVNNVTNEQQQQQQYNHGNVDDDDKDIRWI